MRILSLGILINRVGGYVTVYLALILTVRHVSVTQISLALILSGIFSIIGSACGGMATARIGSRATIFLSMMGSALFTTLLVFAAPFAITATLVCLISFFNRAFSPAAATVVGKVSAPGQRVQMFAFYQFAFNVGAAAGPLIATFLLTRSITALFLIDAFTSGLFAIAALRIPASSDVRRDSHLNIRGARWPIRHDPRFLLFCFSVICVALVYAQTSGPLPLAFTSHHYSVQLLGYLLSANAVAVILFQLPISAAAQKWAPWVSLASGGLFICAGFGILLIEFSLPLLIVNTAARTLGEMLVMPVRPAVAMSMSTEDTHASYQGALSTAQTMGQVLGPSAGVLAYSLGTTLPWILSWVLLVPAAAIPVAALATKTSDRVKSLKSAPITS